MSRQPNRLAATESHKFAGTEIDRSKPLSFRLNGRVIDGFAGDTVLSAVLAAGIAGSLGDSVLGATLQSKRWCEQCRTWTERRVHTCHYRTQHASGLRWMNNDTVNLFATAIGAAVAFLTTVATASR